MGRFHQGKYKPKYPEKYKGDPTDIVFRSSWELKLFNLLDRHPEVEWWQSETLVIPYRSPVDNKMHRYFPDVLVKKKSGETILIEVKPYAQTVEPKYDKNKPPKGKGKQKLLREVLEWGKNSAKWDAARKLCKQRGWSFAIMTEKELGV